MPELKLARINLQYKTTYLCMYKQCACNMAASRYSYTPFFFRDLELRENNQSRKFLICVNAVSIRRDNKARLLTKKAAKGGNRTQIYFSDFSFELSLHVETQSRSQGPLSSSLEKREDPGNEVGETLGDR